MPTNYENARRYLPDKGADNFRWRVDRALKAKKKPLSEWKKDTARADWDRYDTPDRKPLPDKRDLWKSKHHTRSSGEAALLEEPERFVRPGQESRRLLESIKDQIYDFESFKKYARKVLASDKGGFDFFVKDIDLRGTDAGYMALFNTGVVQGWLKENTMGIATKWLRDRFNITDTRAKAIFSKLSQKNKDRLLISAITGKKLRVRLVKPVTERGKAKAYIPARPRIRQVSRTGTSYLRTKPQRFTDMEVRFLHTNARRMPLLKLFEAHQTTFLQTPRTLLSLKNKVRRLNLRTTNV